MSNNKILKMIELVSGAAARNAKEHTEFLDFLETLIVASGPEVSRAFGNLDVKIVYPDGKEVGAGIELTPADYLYWRSAIVERGVRFRASVAEVKMEIFNRLSGLSETHRMTPTERAEFVALVKNTPTD